VPEVRERKAHDPAFRVCRARERQQVFLFGQLLSGIFRQMLRRRLRLQELKGGPAMAASKAIFTKETFRFFRELARNNHKPWMDANRERYRAVVVEPFRVLLDRLAPAALKLNPKFVVTGRVGDNFSRINRDIRFARDKSPYRAQMYIYFAEPNGESGQLYVGLSADTVTCGYRVYTEGRTSRLAEIGRARGREHPEWVERQRCRLGKKYESYWYATERGEWVQRKTWPVKSEDWKKLQGWVVRRKLAPAAATRRGFEREVAKFFREVYPLLPFTTSPGWKR